MKTTLLGITALLLLAACSKPAEEAPTAPAAESAAPTTETDVYAAAVASPDRLPGDYEKDAGRKPAKVLAFFGIKPGMTVLETFAGGGYYTDLLSKVVGPEGHVVAHENTPMVNFGGEEYVARYADGRLPNVEILMAENNEFMVGENEFDAITIILNFHDLYWESEKYGWVKIDVEPFLAELYKGLKPGGILGVVDHSAVDGSPPETGNTLHRIDEGFTIDTLTAAGFVLDGKSDVLRNPDDDRTLLVFDPSIRGKTDRFVLRFRKP